jgi:hypothetical protein
MSRKDSSVSLWPLPHRQAERLFSMYAFFDGDAKLTFRLGPLPELPEFMPGDNWTLVREPSLPGFQLRTIPIALVTLILLAVLWAALTPIIHDVGEMNFPLPVGKFLLCLTGVIIGHEMLHALAHPNLGVSADSVIGLWPSRMFIYTIYASELSKRRCFSILIVPFVTISIIPLVFAVVTRTSSFWVAYISLLNGFLSCGDLLAALMTLRQFPDGAVIRTKGWSTYWRPRQTQQ